MNAAECMRLFVKFTGLADGTPYQHLVDGAITEVSHLLLPDADAEDARLNAYAAAIAHLHFVQFLAAKAECAPTYAGTAAQQRDMQAICHAAETLAAEYRSAAADLLQDPHFVFTGVR